MGITVLVRDSHIRVL